MNNGADKLISKEEFLALKNKARTNELTQEEANKAKMFNHLQIGAPSHVGNYEKCICKDCKFRIKYSGNITDTEHIEEYNKNAAIKGICQKFNDKMPMGLRHKPWGVQEGNATCDLYEKEIK